MNGTLSIPFEDQTIHFTPYNGEFRIDVTSEGLYPIVSRFTAEDMAVVRTSVANERSIAVQNLSDAIPSSANAAFTTFHPSTRTIMLEYAMVSERFVFTETQWQDIFAWGVSN